MAAQCLLKYSREVVFESLVRFVGAHAVHNVCDHGSHHVLLDVDAF